MFQSKEENVIQFVDSLNGILQNRQIQILKESNSQLIRESENQSQLISSLGVTFTVLAIIIAVIAIVIPWILWRQGKEYQTKQQQSIQKHEKLLSSMQKEANKNLQILIEEGRQHIDKLKEEIKEEPNENQKSELLKTLSDYENRISKFIDKNSSDKVGFDESKIVYFSNYPNEMYQVEVVCPKCSSFEKFREKGDKLQQSGVKFNCTECGEYSEYWDSLINDVYVLAYPPSPVKVFKRKI